MNKDAAAHTVTVSGTDIDQQVAGNGQNSFTAPSKPGQYKLTCDFHSQMKGSLTVTG